MISAAASRELIQPFNLEWFREYGAAKNGYSEILKDLFSQVGGNIKNVGVTITSDMALVKRVPVTLGLSESLIDSHMKWEAQQCLVSGRNEFILDYHRLPIATPEGNPQYLMILIRKSVIKELQELFKGIGLVIGDFDIDIFAVARSLQHNYDIAENELAVIADIRRDHFILTIIKQKEFYLSHKTDLDIISADSSIYGENETASLIIKELKRLIFGHKLGSDISAVDVVYLTGSEEVSEISDELNASESLRVELLDPFTKFSISNLKMNNQTPSMFSAAVGMALKQESVPNG